MRSVLFLLVSYLTVQASLLQVAEVYRHGARYPLSDRLGSGIEAINFGELLPAGMRQHYNLGRQLRKEYIEDEALLSPTFNHTEFHIRSTDVNRTIQSAQSQLLGLYPNGPQLPELDDSFLLPPYQGSQNFLQGKGALPHLVQPIPVHIQPDDYEVLDPKCVNEKKLFDQDEETYKQMRLDFEAKTAQIKKSICEKLGETKCDNLDDMYDIYCAYLSFTYQGVKLPQLDENEYFVLNLMSSFNFYYKWAGPQYSRFFSFKFFQDVFKQFDRKINNTQTPLKWLSYSAHDSNVISYLRTLNISNLDCINQSYESGKLIENCQMQPEYAANMIFELHEEFNFNNSDKSYFVKVKYNGQVKQVCKGKDLCPYNEFKQLVLGQLATDQEYQQVCLTTTQATKLLQENENISDNYFYDIIICAQFFFIFALAMILYRKNNKNEEEFVEMNQSPLRSEINNM